MSQGEQPIQAEEFILRRVHHNHVDPGPPIAVNYTAFRPTPDDTAGLSVFREQYSTAAQVAAAGRKPGEYYVVRLSVRDLQRLNLTVVPDEQPGGPPGHALVPELSVDSCKRDRARWREVQVRLAELANQNVVHAPGS